MPSFSSEAPSKGVNSKGCKGILSKKQPAFIKIIFSFFYALILFLSKKRPYFIALHFYCKIYL